MFQLSKVAVPVFVFVLQLSQDFISVYKKTTTKNSLLVPLLEHDMSAVQYFCLWISWAIDWSSVRLLGESMGGKFRFNLSWARLNTLSASALLAFDDAILAR